MKDSAVTIDDGEISLVDIVRFCCRYWKLLFFIPLSVATLALIIALQLPNQYTSKSLMLVPKPLGAQSSISILQSDAILQQVVDRYKLQSYYQSKDQNQAKLLLLQKIKATATKDGQLEITVTDTDPKLAANLANALINATRQQILQQHLTEQSKTLLAAQQRALIAQKELTNAQKELSKLFPKQETILLNSEAAQTLKEFSRLEAMLTSWGNGATQKSLDSPLLQLRLELEKNQSQMRSLPSAQTATLRKIFFNQALLNDLQEQVEMAQAMMEKEVQVLITATPPLEKSGPKRSLIVLVSAFVALAVAISIALVKQVWPRLRTDILSVK